MAKTLTDLATEYEAAIEAAQRECAERRNATVCLQFDCSAPRLKGSNFCETHQRPINAEKGEVTQ